MSWPTGCRCLDHRYERNPRNYPASLGLAAALCCYRGVPSLRSRVRVSVSSASVFGSPSGLKTMQNRPEAGETGPSGMLVLMLGRERAEAVPQRLSDARWALIEPTLTAWRKAQLDRRPTGQPAEVEPREVFKAILSVNRMGIPWKYLPRDVPNHGTVYACYAA